jgi:hypothetical protein
MRGLTNVEYIERPPEIHNTHIHRSQLYHHHLHRHHLYDLPFLQTVQPLLADQSRSWQRMSSSCVEANYMGDVCVQRLYGCIPAVDTYSYVVEVQLEAV